MARAIEIIFPANSGRHRVRNFAEELSLTLGNLGALPMGEADAATDTVVVSNVPTSQVGRCKQLIERLLKKHLLINEAVVRASTPKGTTPDFKRDH